MNDLRELKLKVGCWLHERWRTEIAISAPALGQIIGFEWLC